MTMCLYLDEELHPEGPKSLCCGLSVLLRPHTPLSSGKAAVLALFLFLEVSLGEPKYELQTLVFTIFFSLYFFKFFFFGLLCLHRKLWIGIFVSFYSKFLLSHPPNLEPETTILPHPNSAGRPFDELGMRYSPKCSFLPLKHLWHSSNLWRWCFHAAPRTPEFFIMGTQINWYRLKLKSKASIVLKALVWRIKMTFFLLKNFLSKATGFMGMQVIWFKGP